MWKDNLVGIDGIVFLVDLSEVKDPEKQHRREDSLKELAKLLADEGLRDAGVPIAILGNKTDALNAVNEKTLRHEFKIQDNDRCKLFMSCLLERKGHVEPFHWISTFVTDDKKRARWSSPTKRPTKEEEGGGATTRDSGGKDDTTTTTTPPAERFEL